MDTRHKYLVGTRLPNGSFKVISACELLTHAQAEKLQGLILHDNMEVHELDEETGLYLPMKED